MRISRWIRRAVLCAALAMSVAPVAATAAETAVVFDTAHTTVEFTLGDVLHTVHGSFKLRSGNLTYNPATGQASGQLIVDAASGDSGNGTRDNKMKKEILEVSKYPDIVFTAQQVVGKVPEQGSGTIDVKGIFRIHGADHELTLHVHLSVQNQTANLTTEFAVPYQQWGMKNPSTLFLRVENTVQIKITGVARLSQQ